MLREATAASLTESFFPKDLAFRERCENDVLRASNKLTTMEMNCKESKLLHVEKPQKFQFVEFMYKNTKVNKTSPQCDSLNFW